MANGFLHEAGATPDHDWRSTAGSTPSARVSRRSAVTAPVIPGVTAEGHPNN